MPVDAPEAAVVGGVDLEGSDLGDERALVRHVSPPVLVWTAVDPANMHGNGRHMRASRVMLLLFLRVGVGVPAL